MAGLAEQPLARFLEEVADPRPAPGGGTSAGCTCALAAALVEMAAAIARAEGAARARALRERALELAEQELSSYEPVLVAVRLPRDDPARGARLEAALSDASGPPLAIAEAAAETAELGAEVAAASSPSVRGDAVTGAVLAEAAAAAAASLVEINLSGRTGDERLERAREARRRAGQARAAAAT